VANSTSPTVRRRELSALLRELRRKSGLTVDEVAERLLCSAAKISRIETGHRSVSLRDVRDLCDVYGVSDQEQRDRLMNLARESKERAWWQDYDLPYSTYIGLEAAASSISDYGSGTFPGLLQTEAYARALIEAGLPKVSAEAMNQRVEARLIKQDLLKRDNPPRFWTILDEAVLHREIGGPAVMKAQLEHVVDATRLPNITVQIIPYTAGAHPALGSVFVILEFSEPTISSVVYVEGLVGNLYLERPADLDRYKHVFENLQATALSPPDSIRLIERIAREYAR
jgi:transcriptional regulator with XRE-family HTH domain